ncbi:HTH-Tnp-Tc3-2 domain containing protein, partial [Pyrenophora tritici-repentis]
REEDGGLGLWDPTLYQNDIGRGRPEVLSDEQNEQIIRIATQDRNYREQESWQTIRHRDFESVAPNLSISTFENVMYGAGYKRRKPGWKPPLSASQRHEGLQWALKYNTDKHQHGLEKSADLIRTWHDDEVYADNDLFVNLLSALRALQAARFLQSRHQGKTVFHDLLRLNAAVSSDNFDAERIRPLLDAILEFQPDEVVWDRVYDAVTESTPPPRPTSSLQQTPLSTNTGSFANSKEHRKHVDDVLREELGHLYVGIPGFFDAFFGDVPGLRPAAQAVFDKCQGGDSPLYRLASGWQGWPKGAKEKDVLSWFAPLTDRLLDLAEGHRPILIPGELKSNPLADKASKAWLDLGRYAREVLAAQDSRRFVLGFTLCGSLMRLWIFDRLGDIASEQFNINEDGLQFVSAVLGFLWMNEEQLGFDPTIITVGDKRYIEIERENGKERLVIDSLIKRVPCVAGRATTCWKAYKEENPDTPLVIKDSWQYPEREEEGELLREATEKQVRNVARYFHHETVRVGGQDDDIRLNVRKGLDITKATNYKPGKPMPPPSTTGRRASRRDRSSSSVSGRKRSSSCTGLPLPPSKRTCSSSPTKPPIVNRIHRRVIVSDYGKAIYKASSQSSLLAAMEGCINGYESLHTRAGMLQCDISPNNLMINEEDNDPSWRAFLIDLDLAIKENREKPSGSRGKTGTRAFMAIGVLLEDEMHSFMHDLESFFWVLFWICIHYDGPSKGRVVPQFEKWNYIDTEELAKLKKGEVGDESDFLRTARVTFTPYYQSLIPYVNRLRRKVFPNGGRWRVPNPKLYSEMKEILQAAQDDLKEQEE